MSDYFPEQTVQYVTHIKNTLVEGLQSVFDNHVDPLLQGTKVTIEYPKYEVDYPTVVVRYFERDAAQAGVGHLERVRIDGETKPSSELTVDVTTGGVQLRWDPVANATAYHVWRRKDGINRWHRFLTTSTEFIDNGDTGLDEVPPDLSTTGLDQPLGLTSVPTDGSLFSGRYYYSVAALGEGQVWYFKHAFYNGDVEFAVYALSSYDRDLIRDTIVQTILMGDRDNYTNRFWDRLYPDPDADDSDTANVHFIDLSQDRVQGFGETETPAPWKAEDEVIYMSAYRIAARGEFYSLPPDIPWGVVRKVFILPYIEDLEPIPTGTAGDDGIWVP